METINFNNSVMTTAVEVIYGFPFELPLPLDILDILIKIAKNEFCRINMDNARFRIDVCDKEKRLDIDFDEEGDEEEGDIDDDNDEMVGRFVLAVDIVLNFGRSSLGDNPDAGIAFPGPLWI